MKLGIICNDFEKKSFENVKNMGLDFVEFCVNYRTEEDKSQLFYDSTDRIKADLDLLGLEVGSVGRWGAFKILPDGKPNPYEVKTDEMLIEASSKLGCAIYVTNCNYVDELSLFENYQAAINYFEHLIEVGKKYGIKIATNNCNWNNYLTCDPAWSVVHGHLKDLYIKYDPSHSIYRKKDNYLAEIKKWGDRIVHFHLKGSLLVDGERVDDPPAGLDITNWPAVIALLHAVGYDGTLSIEPHSGIWRDEKGQKGIEYTIQYFKNLII